MLRVEVVEIYIPLESNNSAGSGKGKFMLKMVEPTHSSINGFASKFHQRSQKIPFLSGFLKDTNQLILAKIFIVRHAKNIKVKRKKKFEFLKKLTNTK